MEQKTLSMIKKLINTLELIKIEAINEKTIIFDFVGDVRLFIDATPKGIDFSLVAMAEKADDIIDNIEREAE